MVSGIRAPRPRAITTRLCAYSAPALAAHGLGRTRRVPSRRPSRAPSRRGRSRIKAYNSAGARSLAIDLVHVAIVYGHSSHARLTGEAETTQLGGEVLRQRINRVRVSPGGGWIAILRTDTRRQAERRARGDRVDDLQPQ